MKDKFKAHFELPKNGFLEPIDLQDTTLGFSVYKTRSEKGFKSLFRVYVKNEELNKLEQLKPLTVTASYGKESSNGIILSSNEFKRKSNWPTDFISEGEFLYNIESDKLYYKGKEIDGIKLLDIADSWHTKTTKLFGGAWLRFKLFWFHYIQAGFWKIIFHIIAFFQYLASGEKIKIFHDFTNPRTSNYQTLNVKESELINLWGYKVKPWIAGIYGFLHLFIYIIFYYYNYRPLWLITVFKTDFLAFMYGVVSLGLANTFLPILLSPIKFKDFLKLIQSIYWSSAIRRVRI